MNRGALRKEGAPIHTFCVVLTNTAASMTTPGAAAAKAAATTAAGAAETATGHASAVCSFSSRHIYCNIKLRNSYFVIITQRIMRCIEQLT